MSWLYLLIPGIPLLLGYLALRRYMLTVEPFLIDITTHDVYDPCLPDELDGVCLCQVSDLHITPLVRNRLAVTNALNRIATGEITGTKPDLFLFTGDMIFLQAGIAPFFTWLDSLGDTILPALFVLGNAENKSYVRRSDVEKGFATRHLSLLNNTSLRVCLPRPDRPDALLQVVGVDDPHTRHSDFPRAYANADPNAWTLLLCHSPDGIVELHDFRADLMLCGHTHGGQVRLPRFGAIAANTRRVKGLVMGWYTGEVLRRQAKYAVGNVRMYISRGLGGGNFPGRLNCRPEIALFTLRKAASDSQDD